MSSAGARGLASRLIDRLTPRELEILRDLARGWTARDIARKDWRSVDTVRTQVKSIRQKLGVHSQLSAVAVFKNAQEEENQALPASRDLIAGSVW